MKLVIFFLFSCLVLAGCAQKGEQQPIIERPAGVPHNYRVSVKNDGRPVENFSEPLVHRVNMTEKALAPNSKLMASGSRPRLTGKVEVDGRGKPMGFRMSEADTRTLALLKLKNGDLVTSAAGARVKRPEDVLHVFSELKRSKRAALTLERSGKPHKFLYSLP